LSRFDREDRSDWRVGVDRDRSRADRFRVEERVRDRDVDFAERRRSGEDRFTLEERFEDGSAVDERRGGARRRSSHLGVSSRLTVPDELRLGTR
jgi:hypothetical protein